MPNVFNYRKKRTPTNTTRKYSKKNNKKSLTNVRQIVKKTINNMAETKQIGNNPAAYIWGTNNTTMSPVVKVSNVWDMGLGTANGQRIGNKITVSKAVMNMNITAPADSASLLVGPYIVSIYFGYLKGNRGSQPTNTDLTKFLQDGPTSVGIDQTTLSLLRNVNADLFVITNKLRFKVGHASSEAFTDQNNNDFPLFVNKKISLKTMLGPVSYDDNAGAALNRDLYMWCQFTSVFSSTISGTAAPVFNYYLDGEYKDF